MVKFSPVHEPRKGLVVYEKVNEIVQDAASGDYRGEVWYRKCVVVSTDVDNIVVKRRSRTLTVSRRDLCEVV